MTNPTWDCGRGGRKVSSTVTPEFTCIRIQVVLRYCGTLQKTHPKISYPHLKQYTLYKHPLYRYSTL